ncbi:metallophosphoesterase family protein [Catelliglobosispora koreensis]|uniref:metallophosphoesterase family protein n=1 Tax=Catelliglobosispora koreensis TaxID=129052 RepID=UPI000371F8F8|nr:metallophosphoesterase family protein [Catelliglobosispora koreensis]
MTLHGPWPGEGAAPRYGALAKVAVIADVHGNIPALEAVLAEIDALGVDLIVHCGDLTWGPEPERTFKLLRDLPAVCVRGNADRAVVELARGLREPGDRPRDPWMPGQHSEEAVAYLAEMPFTLVVEVTGLGAVRFCHGSPRSDTECVTPATPAERFEELSASVSEQIIVTGHTHLQFDRRVAGRRSVNPGSVGLPYHEGPPGTAYWALFGPDVELRQTRYDVSESVARAHEAGDPSADTIAQLLTKPPTSAEVTAHAEGLVFSD